MCRQHIPQRYAASCFLQRTPNPRESCRTWQFSSTRHLAPAPTFARLSTSARLSGRMFHTDWGDLSNNTCVVDKQSRQAGKNSKVGRKAGSTHGHLGAGGVGAAATMTYRTTHRPHRVLHTCMAHTRRLVKPPSPKTQSRPPPPPHQKNHPPPPYLAHGPACGLPQCESRQVLARLAPLVLVLRKLSLGLKRGAVLAQGVNDLITTLCVCCLEGAARGKQQQQQHNQKGRRVSGLGCRPSQGLCLRAAA